MNFTSIFTVLVIFASFPSQAEIPETEDAILVTTIFGAGKWSVERHPRFIADVNGDGRDDIVAFGGEGVFVALSTSTADVPSFAKHSRGSASLSP